MLAMLFLFLTFSYQNTFLSSMRDGFKNINEKLKPLIFEVRNNCEKNFYALKEKYESFRKIMRENLNNFKNFIMQKIKNEESDEPSKMTDSEQKQAEEAIKQFLEQFMKQKQEDVEMGEQAPSTHGEETVREIPADL